MPGVGDFNLAAFFRAMGIKNPQPSVRESVQPVVVVGQFAGLTPRYENPTGSYGGNVVAVALEFSYFTLTAAAPGGCLLRAARCDAIDLLFGTGARVPGLVVLAPSGQYSVNPMRSVVEFGTDAIQSIGTATANPKMQTNVGLEGVPLYVPPNVTAIFQTVAANQSITDFAMIVEDLPSAENSTV